MKSYAWLSSSLVRVFPSSPPCRCPSLSLNAARGERLSFQACIRIEHSDPHSEYLSPVEAQACIASARIPVTLRRVGLVPVPHHNTLVPDDELDGLTAIPGYVPDPLFPESQVLLYDRETTAFWCTVEIPRDHRQKTETIRLELRLKEKDRFRLTVTLRISEAVVSFPRRFSVTHWFYADALCDWYKLKAFEPAFWPIVESYMRNYASHGSNTIYVPVFTPPLDGIKRPTQLLGVKRVSKDRYAFDWRQVLQWIKTAKRCGVSKFEWTHLFTQWGCKHAIRIYEGPNDNERLLWPPETSATSPVYRNFLSQFLPAFRRFLQRERLESVSYFHVSDEPHGDEAIEYYRKARAMLKELAPWIRVMDALSDIRFGREHLTDMPVPSITEVPKFIKEGIPCWSYFCCGPRARYLNRQLDTPLTKVRMSGWLFYRFQVLGFLHWGYNYWYKSQTRQLIDPFTVTNGMGGPGWAHGDTFVVYPGPDGPLDSIRWEVFAESLQDYALLEERGVDPHGRLLKPLRDFEHFPKTEQWIKSAREALLGDTP